MLRVIGIFALAVLLIILANERWGRYDTGPPTPEDRVVYTLPDQQNWCLLIHETVHRESYPGRGGIICSPGSGQGFALFRTKVLLPGFEKFAPQPAVVRSGKEVWDPYEV